MGRNRRRRNSIRVNKMRERQDFDSRRFIKELGQWILSIAIVVVLGYSIITFGVQTLKIVGQSMNPILENGDTVLVNKMVYNFKDIERYDIVAFKLRDDEDSYYNVKRIIGMPGETIKIEGGHVFINGKSLDNLPFGDLITTEGIAGEGITLGNNEYFVIGDNVNNSDDSRFVNVGCIEETEILGKISYRISPSKDRGKIE